MAGRRSPDQFDVYRAAALKASARGDHAEAEKQWLAALELAESDEDETARLTPTLESLAETFWYQQKFDLAALILRRLLRNYERRLGKKHFDVGIVANNMAMLYHAWGKYAEAEPFYRQALDIKEGILGKTHPDVAVILGNYRDLLTVLKRDDEARKLDAFVLLRLQAPEWRRSGALSDSLPNSVIGPGSVET